MTQTMPWPEIDFSIFGETETLAINRIQKVTAAVLTRNWVSIPHVTHHDDADITELERFRKELNATRETKLSPLPFIVKAMARALKAFPRFNASLDANGETLTLKKYVHIGIAVDTPQGLVVPVIRDCDSKSLDDLAGEIAAMSERARTKGLPMSAMMGGCMTISSLGGIGGTAFTPIINAPEVAILGVTRSTWQPRRAADGSTDWRFILPLSLSYDHRVINGADAARFTVWLADALARPAALAGEE